MRKVVALAAAKNAAFFQFTGDTMGGNLWGYIMDNQPAWLKTTLTTLQADPNIDHVFVTHHTPVFQNSGHVNHYNSMWMKGENRTPVIEGTPPLRFIEEGKGSIDRRDEILRTLLAHPKVKTILVGTLNIKHPHGAVAQAVRVQDVPRIAAVVGPQDAACRGGRGVRQVAHGV